MLREDPVEVGAQLLGMLLALQTRSAAYRTAFAACAAYILGEAHHSDEARHDESLRACQLLKEQEGAATEWQLHEDLNVFCTTYWAWYRLVAAHVMATTLQHPTLVHLLVENPQLCLSDALALWQQRN